MILVNPFSYAFNDGAGWANRKIFGFTPPQRTLQRSMRKPVKILWGVLGLLCLPFLPSIFTTYMPIATLIRNRDEEIWLNGSQTFGSAIFLRRACLVCHDLQCHRRTRFAGWTRWAEGLLLRSAAKVVVLSGRDGKIVRRLYRVSPERVQNAGPLLTGKLKSFKRVVNGPVRTALFLGSLGRKENREALAWFVHHVVPSCPALRVLVVGATRDEDRIQHVQLSYLGYVNNLDSVFSLADLAIAPMFSDAGVKIKVIESLEKGCPVLGTRQAYSGLPRPCPDFISNSSLQWSRLLNQGAIYDLPPAYPDIPRRTVDAEDDFAASLSRQEIRSGIAF